MHGDIPLVMSGINRYPYFVMSDPNKAAGSEM
jgi:hypothetical protein